jgi:hypothetical protein
MTMGLVHPSLTTTGRRKGKQKFKSAAHAQQARALAAEWDKKQEEWKKLSNPVKPAPKREALTYKLSAPAGRETVRYPSLGNGMGVAPAPVHKVYTGTKMLGIGTLHKSNGVPIFSEEEAIDIATMRR